MFKKSIVPLAALGAMGGAAWGQTTVQSDAVGRTSDSAWVSGNGTVVGILKNMANGQANPIPNCGSLPSCFTIGGTFPVANSIGGATPALVRPVGGAVSSAVIKNTAGTLFGINISNTSTHIANVRVYDTSATPTCSSATNLVYEYDVMAVANSTATMQVYSPNLGPVGVSLSNGLSYCMTGAFGTTDTTNGGWATGDIVVHFSYK